MPAVQGYISGATGAGHGVDAQLVTPQLASLEKAKVRAMYAIALLWDNAITAQALLRAYQPHEPRLALQCGINRTATYDGAASPCSPVPLLRLRRWRSAGCTALRHLG